MAILFLLHLLLFLPYSATTSPSPYLSSTTLFQNYENMLKTFKIFIYTPSKPFSFPTHPASLFYDSLLRSSFLTVDPNQAHLFFVPFSQDTSARSLGRVIREIRNNQPYWNRTLGADHFFVSPDGIDYSSDRNVLELKKNSVQISVFPVISGYFVPHKDITMPPFSTNHPIAPSYKQPEENSMTGDAFLGYLKWNGKTESNLVNDMKSYDDFLVEEDSEPLDYTRSKFCLFFYRDNASGIIEAMSLGCVPVVIVDRPIQDLPLMDVLRWSDLSLLVSAGSGGAERLKELLSGVREEKYAEMREMCVMASKHLFWKEDEPQRLDAFHMVMYQLWMRRHAVRYERREFISRGNKLC